MRKILTTVLLAVFAVGFASAQVQQSKKPARHYINFAYAQQEVNFDAYIDADDVLREASSHKADWAVAAEFGSTFFMHRKPIVGMLRIGLDFSYLDIQYGQFKKDWDNDGELVDSRFANIGMQIGPSLTVTPFKALNLKGYVHYAPSFAAYSPESWDNVFGGYAGYITGGVQVSLTAFTFGIEMRGATSDFHSVKTDEDSLESGSFTSKVQTKLPSTRFIFGFRF